MSIWRNLNILPNKIANEIINFIVGGQLQIQYFPVINNRSVRNLLSLYFWYLFYYFFIVYDKWPISHGLGNTCTHN